MGKIKVLFVSAECYPYAAVGGLGEVSASLPKALSRKGEVEIQRVIPGYKCISGKKQTVTDFPVPMGKGHDSCILKTDPEETEVPTYFVCNDKYFYRDHVYGYNDDGQRFFFLCKAVSEMLSHISFQPDIIHLNDWHTGMIPLLIRKTFPNIKTVFTIHNILYRGNIEKEYVEEMLSDDEKEELGNPEYLDFMKAGLRFSGRVTAVSPEYGKEIYRPEITGDLDQLIKGRKDRIKGILNGIDMESYNPGNDGVIPYPYTWDFVENKKKNKKALCESLGLPKEERPLVSMVTRLEWVKGLDLVVEALELLRDQPFYLLIHGSGQPYYHGLLSEMVRRYPDKVVVNFDYSSKLAKMIYAASDYYLMPSFYEPCGVGQLYALRYGAVPIVNPVGGLKDTVRDDKNSDRNNGFHMKSKDANSLAEALMRAFSLYGTKELDKIRENGMKEDWSWEKSASSYMNVYRDVSGIETNTNYK